MKGPRPAWTALTLLLLCTASGSVGAQPLPVMPSAPPPAPSAAPAPSVQAAPPEPPPAVLPSVAGEPELPAPDVGPSSDAPEAVPSSSRPLGGPYPRRAPYDPCGWASSGDEPPPAKIVRRPGDIIPPCYRLETEPRKGLVIAGAVTFGALYLLSAVAGAALEADTNATYAPDDEQDAFWPLLLPVVGPFAALGTIKSSGEEDSFTAGRTILLLVDGLGQGIGLAMLISGALAEREMLVWDGVSGTGSQLSLGPAALGHGAWGLGLAGRH